MTENEREDALLYLREQRVGQAYGITVHTHNGNNNSQSGYNSRSFALHLPIARGVTIRSMILHLSYLSLGSSVNGWQSSSAFTAIFIRADDFGEKVASSIPGGSASVPSGLK